MAGCGPSWDERPPSYESSPTPRASVTTEDVQGAASASMTKILSCYASDSSFGWVKLSLHIGKTGMVDKFEDAGSTVSDQVLSCVQGVLGATRFPECASCSGYVYKFGFKEEPTASPLMPMPNASGSAAPLAPPPGADAGTPLTPDDKWM
jgi:hypothetical protein